LTPRKSAAYLASLAAAQVTLIVIRSRIVMLSKQQAQLLVESEISKPDYYSPDLQVVIVDSSTIEREWGWVFFYQSSEYLETGMLDAMIAG